MGPVHMDVGYPGQVGEAEGQRNIAFICSILNPRALGRACFSIYIKLCVQSLSLWLFCIDYKVYILKQF